MHTTEAKISVPAVLPSLRPVRPGNEQFLYSLFCAIRGPEFALALQEPHLSALLRMQFEAQQTDYTRRFGEQSHFLVILDGTPAGRIWIYEDAEGFRVPDISILPSYQRRGIGAFLYRQVMERAAAAGKPIHVTVFHSNDSSAAFHSRLGFRFTGEENMYAAMEWRP